MTKFEDEDDDSVLILDDDCHVKWIEEDFEYGFKFFAKKQHFKLTTDSEEIYKKWQKGLRPRVLLSDFDSRY